MSAVGHREQLGGGLRRGAAADEDRHVGHRAAHALDVGRAASARPGGAARDDEAVGEAAVHEIARVLLEVDRRQRHGVLAADVGEDPHVGAEQPAVAQEVVGVGIQNTN